MFSFGGRKISRNEQRLETAAKVLASASTLFRTQGFATTTIRDIAADCGVSVGSVIAVGDKNALLVASFDQLIKKIHDERARGIGAIEGIPVEERIADLFNPFVEIFMEHPGLARVYGSILVAGEQQSIIFTELSRTLLHEISAVLTSDLSSDEEEALQLAESIYFAYIGRLFTWPSSDIGSQSALKQDLQRIVATICARQEPKS